jgi:hypothetical protein
MRKIERKKARRFKSKYRHHEILIKKYRKEKEGEKTYRPKNR